MNGWTVITGASEGLGVEFARMAAKNGRDMVLTARSEEKLAAVAEEMRGHGCEVVVIPADLNDLADAERFWSQASDGRSIDIFVNNAGLGRHGTFTEGEWERELSSINVNVLAYTYLLKQAAAHMKAAGKGRIINVSSTAAFMAGPNMAVYHATKAYALSLSEAVAQELKGTGVKVSALCPGATATNFFNDADMGDARLLRISQPMRAADVAELGWLQARIGQRVVVPGLMNKGFAIMAKLMPRGVVNRVADYVMGKG